MKFGSVCSGIGAPEQAWKDLGWESAWHSEIEPFPSAVFAARHGGVNLGDMTKFKEWPDESINLLVGGTPCQSFSVAGLRKGLTDPRGNLMLTFGAIAERYRPEWLVWENVPGVLSSNGGRDFGTFLGMLGQLGYGFAYRVLDAQFFGVAQRRRRVFVVGYLGDWRRAAAVLFERESLRGDNPPSREAGEKVAASLAASSGGCNDEKRAGAFVKVDINKRVGKSLCAHGNRLDFETQDFITYGIDEECNVSSQKFGPLLRGGQGGTRQAVAFSILPMNSGKDYKARETDIAQPIMANGPVSGNQGGDFITNSMQVRRLTPIECERLQGFPDNHTQVKWRGKTLANCPDGPRYKALGNSMAVPVMEWIGKRIEAQRQQRFNF